MRPKRPKFSISRFAAVEFSLAVGVAALAGLLVRFFLFTSYFVADDSMMPAFGMGDRLLSNNIPKMVPWGTWHPDKDQLVTFKHPLRGGHRDIKRISARSGDTVQITGGVIYINGEELPQSLKNRTPITKDNPFTDPRFDFEPYVVPGPGDTLFLENLDARDFEFAYNLIRQEAPSYPYTFSCELMVNEKLVSDSGMAVMFQMPADSISKVDLKSYSWVDLVNLETQLSNRFPKDHIRFIHTLYDRGQTVELYIVKNNSYFVVGDNLSQSYDSRYWGAVSYKNLLSKPFIVYWSHEPGRPHKINFARILKFIH